MPFAMNDESGLKYLLTDQLGSVVAVTNDTGGLISQQRYLPFGQVRTDVSSITQTDFGFTGQRNNTYINLDDYKSRWYSAYLNQWTQPDSIIPNVYNPQSLNRFSYVMNRPTVLTDPTGHHCADEDINGLCPEDSGYDSGGISITPSSCPTCYHTVGQNSQSNQYDPLKEFSILTGITPQSACNSILHGAGSEFLCNPSTYNRNNYSINVGGAGTPQEYAQGLQTLQYGYGFLNDLSDARKFLYTSEGMRAINPDPVSDFMIGASFQGVSDQRNPNLSPWQKAGRAALVGGESIGTDLGSLALGVPGMAAGEAVVPEGGGIVGFAVVRLASSVAIDQGVWGNINQTWFPAFGLGNP